MLNWLGEIVPMDTSYIKNYMTATYHLLIAFSVLIYSYWQILLENKKFLSKGENLMQINFLYDTDYDAIH